MGKVIEEKYDGYACFSILKTLLEQNETFRNIVLEGIKSHKISVFSEDIWNLIRKQNFMPPRDGIDDFEDFFKKGHNIGSCLWTSRQLSFSFNDVDLVSGILPCLKGTFNAEREGGHVWLENDGYIIDTTLMLVIDKSLKDSLGYIEEQRIARNDLWKLRGYNGMKDFVNDKSIKKK